MRGGSAPPHLPATDHQPRSSTDSQGIPGRREDGFQKIKARPFPFDDPPSKSFLDRLPRDRSTWQGIFSLWPGQRDAGEKKQVPPPTPRPNSNTAHAPPPLPPCHRPQSNTSPPATAQKVTHLIPHRPKSKTSHPPTAPQATHLTSRRLKSNSSNPPPPEK